ncbi:hypothetical protein Vadar_010516 [Vaccinium darrowii]|uniref:Uncharacterized protein n=1 Tax=Vaccinium darrowii TaxID=229202 RepID=A0ACB7XPN6_9ERIC|nr:hypothetical protein Vadar_010516 [Vaccinium darrowii]
MLVALCVDSPHPEKIGLFELSHRLGDNLALRLKRSLVSGIINDFDEPGFLAPSGLNLGGAKDMVIQGEAGAVIRGKKEPGNTMQYRSSLTFAS